MKLLMKLTVLAFFTFMFSTSYAKNIVIGGVTYKSCQKGSSANGQTKFKCNGPKGQTEVSCDTSDVAETSRKYWKCSARSKGPKAVCSFVKSPNGTYELNCRKLTKDAAKNSVKMKKGR